MDKKIRVLFICTKNSGRSQIAEGFLRKHGGDSFEVYSAGVKSTTINPLTVKVMEESGVDMASHYSKSIDKFINEEFDYVITVCANADKQCPNFPGKSKKIHWYFDDPDNPEIPEDKKLTEFRRIRDEIEEKIKLWIINPEAESSVKFII